MTKAEIDNFPSGICPSCKRVAITHKHYLAEGLLDTLMDFAKIYKGEPVNLTEAGFAHNQKCNFQKLKYFGLVTKNAGKKGGSWMLTKRGHYFCLNKRTSPKSVWTFGDKVILKSEEQISIKTHLKDGEYWKKYEDYLVSNG